MGHTLRSSFRPTVYQCCSHYWWFRHRILCRITSLDLFRFTNVSHFGAAQVYNDASFLVCGLYPFWLHLCTFSSSGSTFSVVPYGFVSYPILVLISFKSCEKFLLWQINYPSHRYCILMTDVYYNSFSCIFFCILFNVLRCTITVTFREYGTKAFTAGVERSLQRPGRRMAVVDRIVSLLLVSPEF